MAVVMHLFPFVDTSKGLVSINVAVKHIMHNFPSAA